MGRADHWTPGDPNAICDVCGFKYKLSQLKKRWDGIMACPMDWEIRQPQDMVRGVKDQRQVPNARPEPPDTFVTGFVTTPIGATTITVTASPFTFTNTTGFPQTITINDGTVSNVSVNGISQATSGNVEVVVPRAQSVVVTYTVAPTMFFWGQS